MPRIITPQSDPALPRPVFSGEQFGALQGRALEGLGQDVSRIGDAITRREQQRDVSRLTAEFARTQAELAVEWDEALRTADPNDPELADRFRRERLQTRLADLRNLANTDAGRQYFTTASAGLEATFLKATEAGQAGLAEVAAVRDWQTISNRLGDSVVAAPGTFPDAIAMGRLHIEGLIAANGLSREQALRLEADLSSTLAFAAARGSIERDPVGGREAVDLGEYAEFLTPEQKTRLLDYADGQVSAREAARRKALDELAKRTTTEYLQAAVDPSGRINAEALPQLIGAAVRDDRLSADPDTQRTMFNLLRSLADSEGSGAAVRTDSATFDDLLSRSLLPRGDPRRPSRNEVYGMVGRGLKVADANFLVSRIDGEGDPAEEDFNRQAQTTFSVARRFITGSDEGTLVDDPAAELNYQSFQGWATQEVRRLKEEGRTAAEIFAFDGPIMSQLGRFKKSRTLEEQVKLMSSSFTTGIPVEVISPPERVDPVANKPLSAMTPAEMDEWLRRNGGQ